MTMPIFAYQKIKPLRQAKQLSQVEIAAELGISRPTFVLMETGEKEPTLSQLYTLARLLGVEPEELCTNLPASGTGAADYLKFKELVIACADRGSENSISKTKLALLTYLADFAWHFRHAQPMTGETYRYSIRGPVADDFLRSLDELYESQALALEPAGSTLSIRVTEKPAVKLLQPEEIALIEQICTKWKNESTEMLYKFVSSRLSAKTPKTGVPIPYESILAETDNSLF